MKIEFIQFDSDAEEEYYKSAKYYKDIDPRLSKDSYAEVEAVLQQIKKFPESGYTYLHKTRRVFLNRFPFAIIYRCVNKTIYFFCC